MAECLAVNEDVVGSSPTSGAITTDFLKTPRFQPVKRQTMAPACPDCRQAGRERLAVNEDVVACLPTGRVRIRPPEPI